MFRIYQLWSSVVFKLLIVNRWCKKLLSSTGTHYWLIYLCISVCSAYSKYQNVCISVHTKYLRLPYWIKYEFCLYVKLSESLPGHRSCGQKNPHPVTMIFHSLLRSSFTLSLSFCMFLGSHENYKVCFLANLQHNYSSIAIQPTLNNISVERINNIHVFHHVLYSDKALVWCSAHTGPRGCYRFPSKFAKRHQLIESVGSLCSDSVPLPCRALKLTLL